ncbi:MAG: hypothetical protein K9H61_04155 [Bacteroidia bacterium]|nr:hypothetical protein [Bacteroidia bacterium]MCF8426401.1 hypothetical protein [Bacteroidia bacterium]MCF8446169.1 hypothetical protein [Bacteroidia bacterium]
MKKIFIPLTILVSIFLFQWSCKNPLNELSDFKLNINGGALINPIANINFAYDDSSTVKPNNIRVSFTGNGAKYIYDEFGQHLFKVAPDGSLKIILGPNANPTKDNPIMVRISVTADDCLPFEDYIYIFDRNEMRITFLLTKEINAPANIKVQNYSANFLGKKASDSLVLEHTNKEGITFKFTYPKQGVIFVNREDIYFYEDEIKTVKVPIKRDTTVLDTVTIVKNATRFHNNQPIDGTAERILAPVKKTLTIGYWDSSYAVPVLRRQTICDTIPVQNVNATVYSNASDIVFASGFYDENGLYVDKPRKFVGAIQVPSVYFYTNDKKGHVYPIYSGAQKGPTIEVSFNEAANYNLFMSGTGYNKETNRYFAVESVVPATDIKLDANRQFKFENDLFYTNYFFFFKTIEAGCGFGLINWNTKDIDLLNFDIEYSVQTKHQYLWGRFSPYHPEDGIRIASFNGEDEATIRVTLDHSLNKCEGKPLLYQKTEKINTCSYINTPYIFNVDYNTDDFMSKYTFAPLEVTTDLICKTGSKVTLPDQTINFRREGCPEITGKLYLNGGKGKYSLLPDIEYTMFVYSPENQQELSNTFKLTGKASETILGLIKNSSGTVTDTAYIGKIQYDAGTRKYNLHVDLFNKVFKYKIPGCN